jgi:hypothetical protein
MPVPSGVVLLAELEGQARERGKNTLAPERISSHPDFDWDSVYWAVRRAIDNGEGSICNDYLAEAFAHYNLTVIDKGESNG